MNNEIVDKQDKMQNILSAYESRCPNDTVFSYNLIYNDLKCFPVNVDNPAHVAQLIKEAEGIPLYVPISNFCDNVSSMASQKVYGLDVDELDGKRFYIAVSLANNKRINQRGILMQQNAIFGTAEVPVPILNRSWLEVEKIFTLNNTGYVEITYA